MAPRKLKDRRGGAIDLKEESVTEAASSALGDDASQKKKRGRPRKAASAMAYTDKDADDDGGEHANDEEDVEEEGEASNEEQQLADEYQVKEEEKGMSTIAKETQLALDSITQEEQKKKREVLVMKKKKTKRVTHKDGMDLQSDLIKCFGRKNHKRKGKPTRAAQASF